MWEMNEKHDAWRPAGSAGTGSPSTASGAAMDQWMKRRVRYQYAFVRLVVVLAVQHHVFGSVSGDPQSLRTGQPMALMYVVEEHAESVDPGVVVPLIKVAAPMQAVVEVVLPVVQGCGKGSVQV